MPNQNFRVKNGLEVGTGATISSGGNITAGIISATSFVGNGSQLTGIVASGTVNYANISGVSSSVVGGAVSATSLTVTGVSTFEGAISVRNGYNLNIGDNNDLRIYNDGTHSRIEETGSGSLYISGSDINIQQDSTNETLAKFIGGGAAELYYNDSKKFETTGTGVTVTGTLVANQLSVSGVSTFQNNVYLGDSDVLNLGDSNDLQISHNPGVTPYNFINGGTTSLTIRSGDLDIQSGSQNYTSFLANNTNTIISWSGTNSDSKRVKVDQTSVELYADVKVLPISSYPAKFSVGTGGTIITATSGGMVGIGSENPTSKFVVVSSGNRNWETRISGTDITLANNSINNFDVIQPSYIIQQNYPYASFPFGYELGSFAYADNAFSRKASVAFFKDTGTGTGIYLSPNGSSGLTGGAGDSGITIRSSGNVGMGLTNPTSKLQVSGTITGTSVNDSIGNVRAVPQNAKTSAYILAASDVGKHIGITTGGVTVDAGIFSAGDAVSIYNNSSSNQTITQGTSVTMYLVGTATTGNRTLAQRGVATVLCVGTDTFVIMGGGLT